MDSIGCCGSIIDYEGRTGLPLDGDWDLDYDGNGNLIYDESRDIVSISYNHLNQPEVITFAVGSRIENSYTSDGRKWLSVYVLPDSTRMCSGLKSKFVSVHFFL